MLVDPLPQEETALNAAFRWIPITLFSGAALVLPVLAQGEASPSAEDLCAPKGMLIPFETANPRAWNTWVLNTDLKDV